jgi:hypothetical protein
MENVLVTWKCVFVKSFVDYLETIMVTWNGYIFVDDTENVFEFDSSLTAQQNSNNILIKQLQTISE